jgi:5'-nucleotidase
MMKLWIVSWVVLVVSSRATQAQPPPRPLNIVLTNDDGFETSLIQSLFRQLVLAGHNVIMSAPYQGQSGTSGLIDFLRPIPATSRASPKGTIATGQPGVGLTTLAPNQYYVNGAVTGAVLYGVDVLAPAIFTGPLDLVMSGPNEGQNVGLFQPHSGTVGAVVTTLNRGIPSIACSADASESETDLVGRLMVKLLNGIPRTSTGGVQLNGAGLNVNFPKLDANTTVSEYSFFGTTTGVATNTVGLRFVPLLSACPIAIGAGLGSVNLPGMCFAAPYTAAGYPFDGNPFSEGNLISNGQRSIAVTVIEGTFQASPTVSANVLGSLSSVLGGCASTFRIYSSTTNAVIGSFTSGGTINNLPCSMNIEVVPSCGVVGAMTIRLYSNNVLVNSRVERNAPYFAFGDNAGDVLEGRFAPGRYSMELIINGSIIKAVPFTVGTCV